MACAVVGVWQTSLRWLDKPRNVLLLVKRGSTDILQRGAELAAFLQVGTGAAAEETSATSGGEPPPPPAPSRTCPDTAAPWSACPHPPGQGGRPRAGRAAGQVSAYCCACHLSSMERQCGGGGGSKSSCSRRARLLIAHGSAAWLLLLLWRWWWSCGAGRTLRTTTASRWPSCTAHATAPHTRWTPSSPWEVSRPRHTTDSAAATCSWWLACGGGPAFHLRLPLTTGRALLPASLLACQVMGC